jgi:hypothetical protein
MHFVCSTTHRLLVLGEGDEGDVGVGDALADEVLGAVTASAAVVRKSGGSDIGDAEGKVSTSEDEEYSRVWGKLTRR